MDDPMFWLISLIAAIVTYRLLFRRMVTPKARVTAMLKRYHALERTGLSERDCLLQLLATRNEWEKFSHALSSCHCLATSLQGRRYAFHLSV